MLMTVVINYVDHHIMMFISLMMMMMMMVEVEGVAPLEEQSKAANWFGQTSIYRDENHIDDIKGTDDKRMTFLL